MELASQPVHEHLLDSHTAVIDFNVQMLHYTHSQPQDRSESLVKRSTTTMLFNHWVHNLEQQTVRQQFQNSRGLRDICSILHSLISKTVLSILSAHGLDWCIHLPCLRLGFITIQQQSDVYVCPTMELVIAQGGSCSTACFYFTCV